MREIKFRAWDCELKQIVDWETLRYTQLFDDGFDNNDCILMLYTGLKDKNGNEIYEGDIVEGHHFSFNGNFDHDNEWIAVVEYSDWASFGCKIIGNDEFIDMYDTSHLEEPCLKVIGNIHENPELLNTEQ